MKAISAPAFEIGTKSASENEFGHGTGLRYIPVAEYTIGCCHYGRTEPYKAVDVKADSLGAAMHKGRELLKPSSVEHVRHIETRPNPEHVGTLVAAGLLESEN